MRPARQITGAGIDRRLAEWRRDYGQPQTLIELAVMLAETGLVRDFSAAMEAIEMAKRCWPIFRDRAEPEPQRRLIQ